MADARPYSSKQKGGPKRERSQGQRKKGAAEEWIEMLPLMTDAEYARYRAVFEGADRFAVGAPCRVQPDIYDLTRLFAAGQGEATSLARRLVLCSCNPDCPRRT
jgi:hypothetical protein